MIPFKDVSFYITILGYPSAREEVSTRCPHLLKAPHNPVHRVGDISLSSHNLFSSVTPDAICNNRKTFFHPVLEPHHESDTRHHSSDPMRRPLTALSGSCLRGGRLGLPRLLPMARDALDHQDGNGCGYTAKANM